MCRHMLQVQHNQAKVCYPSLIFKLVDICCRAMRLVQISHSVVVKKIDASESQSSHCLILVGRL